MMGNKLHFVLQSSYGASSNLTQLKQTRNKDFCFVYLQPHKGSSTKNESKRFRNKNMFDIKYNKKIFNCMLLKTNIKKSNRISTSITKNYLQLSMMIINQKCFKHFITTKGFN